MNRVRTPRRLSRRLVVVAALVLTASFATAIPASAGDDTGVGDRTEASTRIVGGSAASPGAWPSQVGLLYSDVSDNYQAQFCGGTVINRSWVLTAAHCVVPSVVSGPSEVDILTGTQSLTSGGTRHRAAEIRIISGYNADTDDRDVALVRLSTPTTAPVQALIPQNEAVAGGTSAIATGWGTRASGESDFPTQLQQVTVPVKTNAQCSAAPPNGYSSDFLSSSMLCAGQVGKDACQGDSGGPLVINRSGTWTQIGITSWGIGCGGTYPGVYSRVSAFTSWIKAQIRYGPHSDATAFVRRMFLDMYNRQPTSTELFYGVTALNEGTTPASYASTQLLSSAHERRTPGVVRLYRALFLRDPDTSGLAYWWGQVNGGRSLPRIANIMAAGAEFQTRYGSLDNGEFVDQIYSNILGRLPDAEGRAFWVSELSSGRRTRGDVIVGFSESGEYKTQTRTRTNVITAFFVLLRRVPTAGELTTWSPALHTTMVTGLLESSAYHQRI